MTEENKQKTKGRGATDVAIFGCLTTGVLGCVGGLTGIATHEIAGGGLCLLAAAAAFGVIAYISFSD